MTNPTPLHTVDYPLDEETVPALHDLLNDIYLFITRFVRLPEHGATLMALWVAHVPIYRQFMTTPYVQVHSPIKQSGKSRLLEVTTEIAPNTVYWGSSITEATIFRQIDEKHSALLLDEYDALFRGPTEQTEGIRGLLNMGYRDGAKVPRIVGQGTKMTTREFDVFCPKMFAGLGEIPDTLADRSIALRMVRRTAAEPIEEWRLRKVVGPAHALRDRISEVLGTLDLSLDEPEFPDGLSDRAKDIWEPLLAIADRAGGEWPTLAREAAVALSTVREVEDDNLNLRLLSDIRDIFIDTGGDRITSAALVEQLKNNPEAPWRTYGKKNPDGLNAHNLRFLLRDYGIKPDALTFPTGKARGYLRRYFNDAWERYLPHKDLPVARTTLFGEQEDEA